MSKADPPQADKSTRTQPRRACHAVAFALFVIFLFHTLAGCEKETSDGVNGTYIFRQQTPNGGNGIISLVLSGRDHAVFTIRPPHEEVLSRTEGTYVVEDDQLIVTLNGGENEYTIKPGRLEGEFLDKPLLLKKQ